MNNFSNMPTEAVPLFGQVRDLIVERIHHNEWARGAPLPSEPELAAFYNVSIGTVRKAISELVNSNLVVRQRGRGTFILSHFDEETHHRFLCIHDCAGKKLQPGSKNLGFRKQPATAKMAAKLGIESGDKVFWLHRIRTLGSRAIATETIVIPAALFSSMTFENVDDIPVELYPLYESEFKVRVVRANEELHAVAASKEQSRQLGIEQGFPLLAIGRVAFTLRDKPVEWRRSYYDSRNCRYASEIF